MVLPCGEETAAVERDEGDALWQEQARTMTTLNDDAYSVDAPTALRRTAAPAHDPRRRELWHRGGARLRQDDQESDGESVFGMAGGRQ